MKTFGLSRLLSISTVAIAVLAARESVLHGRGEDALNKQDNNERLWPKFYSEARLAPGEVTLFAVLDSKLVDSEGERLGSVEDLVIDMENGTAPFAIVQTGGSIEKKKVLLPLGLLRLKTPEGDGLLSKLYSKTYFIFDGDTENLGRMKAIQGRSDLLHSVLKSVYTINFVFGIEYNFKSEEVNRFSSARKLEGMRCQIALGEFGFARNGVLDIEDASYSVVIESSESGQRYVMGVDDLKLVRSVVGESLADW